MIKFAPMLKIFTGCSYILHVSNSECLIRTVYKLSRPSVQI